MKNKMIQIFGRTRKGYFQTIYLSKDDITNQLNEKGYFTKHNLLKVLYFLLGFLLGSLL